MRSKMKIKVYPGTAWVKCARSWQHSGENITGLRHYYRHETSPTSNRQGMTNKRSNSEKDKLENVSWFQDSVNNYVYAADSMKVTVKF